MRTLLSYLTTTLLIVLGVVSCASSESATSSQLAARGVFDLACPSQNLQTRMLDYKTRGVTGCGKRATYVEQCDTCGSRYHSYYCNCTWRLDGAVQVHDAPAPAVQVSAEDGRSGHVSASR